MLRLLSFLAASSFSIPRVDYDLHPWTLAFIAFCTLLTVGLIAGIVALGLYAEIRTRNAAHHDPWIEESPADEEAEENVDPFIPDAAEPDVSPQVQSLFDTPPDDTHTASAHAVLDRESDPESGRPSPKTVPDRNSERVSD